MVRSDSWRQRDCVLRYWAYKEELNYITHNVGYEPGDILDIKFYLPMPDSWSEKKKLLMDGKPHQQKPDADNLMKAFKDSLIEKDETVYDERSRKFWGRKGKIVVNL